MENAQGICTEQVDSDKIVDLDWTKSHMKQVYICGNPDCPKNHYVPSEGPYIGEIWTHLSIFPKKGRGPGLDYKRQL